MLKDSPSFSFHEAIPPSVMVGLMAGMLNLVSACLLAETCMPVESRVFSILRLL